MATTIQPPEFFSLRDNYALFRPVAELTLDETVELIDNAVFYCRENEITGLLVDVTEVTGFPSPSVSERFWFISKWAETAGGKVAISMVARAEMITPDKIGITIATNRGLRTDVFTDEADALKWLRTECD